MKKTLLIAVCLLGYGLAADAQKKTAPPAPPLPQKAEPPAPPPPVIEIVNFEAPPPPPVIEVVKLDAPPPPPPPKAPRESLAKKDKKTDAFFKRYPSVKSIHQHNGMVTITKKDGSTDVYDLSNEKDAKALKAKYGDLPPTPAPPAPPPPPVEVIEII